MKNPFISILAISGSLAITAYCQSEIVPRDKYKITSNPSIFIHGGSSTLEINGKKFKDPVSDGIVYIKEKQCWVFGNLIRSGRYNLVFLFADGKIIKIPTKTSTIVRGIGRKKNEDAVSSVISVKGNTIRFKVHFTMDIVGDGEIPPDETYDVDLDQKTIVEK